MIERICSECGATDENQFDDGIRDMCVPCRGRIDAEAQRREIEEGLVSRDEDEVIP